MCVWGGEGWGGGGEVHARSVAMFLCVEQGGVCVGGGGGWGGWGEVHTRVVA